MPATVVSIGNFDGVHLGHAELIRRARVMAGPLGARVVAMTFDPHPNAVLVPGWREQRLTRVEDRERLLVEAGADEVVRLKPERGLLGRTPAEFVDWVIERHSAVGFVEGEDFHFGRGRAGNVDVLRQIGAERGFGVEVVAPVEVALTDQTLARASSTLVRWLLERGRVRDAAAVLGRAHSVVGRVVRGARRGRTIGFPTANVETGLMAPADGVYAAEARLEDGRMYVAAVSVGTNPQFTAGSDAPARTIEAYLLDVEHSGDAIRGLPEYGWGIELRLLDWVRDQATFESVEALVAQIGRDCDRVRAMVEGGAGDVAWMGAR